MEQLWAVCLFTRRGTTQSAFNRWVGFWAIGPKDFSDDVLERIVNSRSRDGEPQLWHMDASRPGEAYEFLIPTVVRTALNLPLTWDLLKLYDNPNVLFHDLNNKIIIDRFHPLFGFIKPNLSNSSDQGKWLSDAGKYSRGPNGETGGPSGLDFL